MRKIVSLFIALFFSLFALMNVQAGEKWDMPMAYSATNFHSQNGVLFADAVRVATGGEIDITFTLVVRRLKVLKLRKLFKLDKFQ